MSDTATDQESDRENPLEGCTRLAVAVLTEAAADLAEVLAAGGVYHV
jgi:hypothetical protein